MQPETIFLTGATGYVGGRLAPRLLQAGYRVRAAVRTPAKLASRPWATHEGLEIVKADLLDERSLTEAARGCGTAFYLVHSMGPEGADFAGIDRTASENMARAAASAGIKRIIYLGGLGDDAPSLSRHLRSRLEVGRTLAQGPVPVTILRAAIILGAGSASFEILRYLADRLPVMVTPAWVRTRCQPIAIRNVLAYLIGCLENPQTSGKTFDIGGPDILTYGELFRIYAEEAGLPKRLIVPVPLLTPRLSSLWIHLVTPVPAAIARPLIEGLRNEVVCKEHSIQDIIPQRLLPCREAIRLAVQRLSQEGSTETCWSDACALLPPEWLTAGDSRYAGGTVLECGYRMTLKATPAEAFDPILHIGGKTGWYYGNILWRLRGLIDRLIGGVGLQRGRRDPAQLRVGDALDFWRVTDIEKPNFLRLLAEMKVPGDAVLEFSTTPVGTGETEVAMLARFLPRGLLGLLYWYSVYPLHLLVFTGTLTGIARTAGRPVTSGPVRFTPVFSHAGQASRKTTAPQPPATKPAAAKETAKAKANGRGE